jgi:hypothetical protein
VISYNTPTADPNLNPDAIDNFDNPADVWTCDLPGGPGSSGSFLDGGTRWALYSISSQATATHTFLGGNLAANQSVSVDFVNTGMASGHSVGINLMAGGSVVFSLYFTGDGPGTYSYTDAGGTGQNSGVGFSYYGTNTLTFTLTSTGYTASFGGASTPAGWSGTLANVAVDQIQIFNDSHQNTSDNQVYFSTLSFSAVPEPGSVALTIVGMAGALFFRRRSRPAP